MKKKIWLSSIFCLVMGSLFSQNTITKPFIGFWSGNIHVNATELEMVLKIKQIENDSFLVSMDSPDQGVKDIPVSETRVKEDSIFIKVKKTGGTYKGRIINDTLIAGSWKQGGKSFVLNLSKVEKIIEMKHPQEPKPPYPYKEQEVTFINKQDNITLAGTLTYPEGKGPFTTVILVTGSGQQNRDEELLGHKPFKLIADYFTRKGIAVLRYDDRGMGGSGGNFSTSTTLDFANDAEAAVTFLQKNTYIKCNKIGILGHSEGGMIAPMVASRNKKVSFIILMAGPGVSGADIILTQSVDISKASGLDSLKIVENNAFNKELYDAVLGNLDNKKAREAIEKIFQRRKQGLSVQEIEDQELSFVSQERVIMSLLSPWFKTFLKTNPAEYLEKTKCPVLAMNGAKDLQVNANINLTAVDSALKKAENKYYTLKKFEGLNHLFQFCETGLMKEYSRIEETIHPEVLEFMVNWIQGLPAKN